MKKINLKEIKKGKIVLVISALIVVLLLLLLINWDRIQYTKVLNDFYSGNHYLESNAKVPKEIRDRYYEAVYEMNEAEYKETIYSNPEKNKFGYKYKILETRNINRFNEIYNTTGIWSKGNLDMEGLQNGLNARYAQYGGVDSNLVKKAYWIKVEAKTTYLGTFVSEQETDVIVYQYKGEWYVYAREVMDT